MFEPSSRYFHLAVATLTTPDGREVVYVRRRFPPPPESVEIVGAVAVAPGERIDLLAARALGDPELFWRLCDANGAVDPDELAEPGRTVAVPAPAFPGERSE